MNLKMSTAVMLLSSSVPAGQVGAQTYIVRRVGGGPAKGFADLHIARAVIPGEKIRLSFATLINPDCSPARTMTTQVIEKPHHGLRQGRVAERDLASSSSIPPRLICRGGKTTVKLPVDPPAPARYPRRRHS